MVRYMKSSRKTSLPDELNHDKFSLDTNNGKGPTNIPIQGIENLFYMKRERKFMNHLQQNIQFAKENNLLKIKISELELRLDNLLKENLNLKRQNSVNESRYRKNLNEQINVLEYGIFKRFDEIILMFDNIRKRENLFNIKSNPLWNKYHPDNALLTPSKKRNRRKSMFLQGDDLPSVNNNNNNLSQPLNNSIDESSIPISKYPHNLINGYLSNTHNCKNIDTKENSNDNIRSSFISEYSIPEEDVEDVEDVEGINKIQQDNTIEIGISKKKDHDNNIHIPKVDETSTATLTQSISSNFNNNNNNKNKKNNISSKSIIKKTQHKSTPKLPPKAQKIKRISVLKDDIMPNTKSNIDTNINLDKSKQSKENEISGEHSNEGRSLRRSTRGKVVNYKLPSLRAKMRRPTEKLVDATIVHDIHDYEVNLNENTIIKEEQKSSSLKQIHNKMLENFEGNDTKLSNNTEKPMADDSNNNNKPPALNLKDTILRKKTKIFNDIPQDCIDSSLEEPFTQDSKSEKNTLNKLPRKRTINSILDDVENKENIISKGTKFNSRMCLTMKHKVNKKLMPSSSSPSQPLTSSRLDSGNNHPSNQILSDITNRNKQRKQVTNTKKKKLLKTAIINDLYNDAEDLDIYDKLNKKTPSASLYSSSPLVPFKPLSSSSDRRDTSENNKENKTVSFRFSDDDLSVFDLFDKPSTDNKKLKANSSNR